MSHINFVIKFGEVAYGPCPSKYSILLMLLGKMYASFFFKMYCSLTQSLKHKQLNKVNQPFLYGLIITYIFFGKTHLPFTPLHVPFILATCFL